MNSTVRHMIIAALVLGAFAAIGTGLVATTFAGTKERIAQNEREALLRTLGAMLPDSLHDNDLPTDTIEVISKEMLGTAKPVTVYRSRLESQPTAAVITAYAPGGYNGSIKILVAIHYSDTILGVRVVSHKETPGLGDGIEIEKSNWIKAFEGHTLDSPGGMNLGWSVKKDGGIFDQFSGATITPRAVIQAVHDSLEYFVTHKDLLFADADITHANTDMASSNHLDPIEPILKPETISPAEPFIISDPFSQPEHFNQAAPLSLPNQSGDSSHER